MQVGSHPGGSCNEFLLSRQQVNVDYRDPPLSGGQTALANFPLLQGCKQKIGSWGSKFPGSAFSPNVASFGACAGMPRIGTIGWGMILRWLTLVSARAATGYFDNYPQFD